MGPISFFFSPRHDVNDVPLLFYSAVVQLWDQKEEVQISAIQTVAHQEEDQRVWQTTLIYFQPESFSSSMLISVRPNMGVFRVYIICIAPRFRLLRYSKLWFGRYLIELYSSTTVYNCIVFIPMYNVELSFCLILHSCKYYAIFVICFFSPEFYCKCRKHLHFLL